MKSAILLALVVLTSGAQLRAQRNNPSPELLGRWRATEVSKGGLGTTLSFRENGTFDFSFGAIVQMPYRMERDEIVFPAATTDGPEQRVKAKFTGQDQLRIGTDQLTRKGAAPDPNKPILGEWMGQREMAGHHLEVRYLFDRDGQCLLLIPMRTTTGSYTIHGSSIHMEIPESPTMDGEYRVNDGILTISTRSGGAANYRRY